MAVQTLASVVVQSRRAGIGMPSSELDVSKRDSGVKRRHDERRPQHVRVDVADTRLPSDRADPAVCGPSVETLARCAKKNRTFAPLSGGQVYRPGAARNEGDHGGLGSLAHDAKRAVPTVETQVLDVGATCLAHT